MSRATRTAILTLAAAAAIAVFLAPGASARAIYSANYQSNDVTAFDLTSGALIGTPIQIGPDTEPYTLAITPDGKTVVDVNDQSSTVSLIDTATGLVSPPIPIGDNDYGVGVTPDGTRAYVAANGDDTVYAIDLQTKGVIGAPIGVGSNPASLAITPDGKHVYVSNNNDGSISVIDTATNQVVGAPIVVGADPYGIAVTPDGTHVLVANQDGYLSVIDTATNTVVAPNIPLGGDPSGIGITPDGKHAYVSNYDDGTVSVVEIATRQVVGSPIPIGSNPEYLAPTPDGKRMMVAHYGELGAPDQILGIDTATNQLTGTPITAGEGTGGIAVVPNQSPSASLSLPKTVRPGVATTLSGAASTDPDGTVAGWSWAFGDTQSAATTTSTVSHTYAKPGKYPVALTVTDNEGCSTAFVFTGQTASCNGKPTAATAATLTVAYPGVKLKCPKSAKGGCKYKLKAVQRKKKGKLKALSAPAKAKAKAGKAVVISLKPKKSSAKKLATAKKVLVQMTTTVAGVPQVQVKKLKIVQ